MLNAILWLYENQPEGSRAIRADVQWMDFQPDDGTICWHLSDASNPFGDVKAGAYSAALIDLYGAKRDRDLLPAVASGDDLVAVTP